MARPKRKSKINGTTKDKGKLTTKATSKSIKQTKPKQTKQTKQKSQGDSKDDKLYLSSDFIQAYVLKGDLDRELVFKRVCGKLPVGVCSKMNAKEINQLTIALDFCEQFRDVNMIKSVEFVEGYFGSMLVGPFDDEGSALKAVELLEIDLTQVEPKNTTTIPIVSEKEIESVLLKDYHDLDDEAMAKEIITPEPTKETDEDDILPELD